MNDAITNGKRAWLYEEHGAVEQYSFTIDHHVNVWAVEHPVSLDADDTVTELQTCAGPYVVGEQCNAFEPTTKMIRLTGCP